MKPTVRKSAKLNLGKGKKYKITGEVPDSITIKIIDITNALKITPKQLLKVLKSNERTSYEGEYIITTNEELK